MRFQFLICILALFVACSSKSNETQSSPATEVSSESKTPGKTVSSTPVDPARELESPKISIRVDGLNTGQAYLLGIYTDVRYRADSAQIQSNGSMVFQRDEPYQPGFYSVYLPNQRTLQLLIDADQTFTLETTLNDLVGSAKIDGNLDNQLLYESAQFERTMDPQFSSISTKLRGFSPGTAEYEELKVQQTALISQREEYLNGLFEKHPNSFFTKFKLGGQNPKIRDVRKPDGTRDDARQVHLYRTEFFDNVDFSDNRLLYTPMIANKLNRYMTELTVKTPDSIISSASYLVDKVLDYPEYFKFFANWIALKFEPTKTELMDAEAVYVHMIKNYFTYDRAFWTDSAQVYALQLRANEMAGSLVGKKGPNVTARDINGKMQSIYDIKAPYVIVYLWNPTCEHCAVETPKLVNFYNQWKSKGVEVYAIAIDTDDAEWREYVRINGMPWINVFDPTNKAIYGKYFVNITPELYVLNPERTIIAKNLKVDQVSIMIDRDKAKR